MAWHGSAWPLLNYSPFPMRHPIESLCIESPKLSKCSLSEKFYLNISVFRWAQPFLLWKAYYAPSSFGWSQRYLNWTLNRASETRFCDSDSAIDCEFQATPPPPPPPPLHSIIKDLSIAIRLSNSASRTECLFVVDCKKICRWNDNNFCIR